MGECENPVLTIPRQHIPHQATGTIPKDKINCNELYPKPPLFYLGVTFPSWNYHRSAGELSQCSEKHLPDEQVYSYFTFLIFAGSLRNSAGIKCHLPAFICQKSDLSSPSPNAFLIRFDSLGEGREEEAPTLGKELLPPLQIRFFSFELVLAELFSFLVLLSSSGGCPELTGGSRVSCFSLDGSL